MVKTGLEIFCSRRPSWARGRRLGLLCHQASVDSSFRHARFLLKEVFRDQLVALFSPQHGLFAEKQDNMVESADEMDPDLHIPIFSLYGERREPADWQLESIDLLLIDLQDVGCRVYTYIWTMYLCMRACARNGVGVVVLDRPNPIGGREVEGNLLKEDCTSFVGMAPIPMRHGMTMGELAKLFMEDQELDLELHVVTMEGWNRDMYFEDTGLPWVWPSPNMPFIDTARVYPGQVLFEGTNVSEGRGTTRPFEIFGAPFIDCRQIDNFVKDTGLTGFVLREQFFEPTFHKWEKRRCLGFQLHVTDDNLYKPYITTLAILQAILKTAPDEFSWRPPPYEYEYERLPADLLIGDRKVRMALEDGIPSRELESMWKEDLRHFQERRNRFLIYR